MQASKEHIRTFQTLKNRSDFVKMNTRAQKWVSHGVIVQALSNDAGQIRAGYTVTKKVSPSAVKRNRIKRRLRAAAADILPKHAKGSCDYVLIGRPLTATRPYESLLNDLKWCLQKMGFDQTDLKKS